MDKPRIFFAQCTENPNHMYVVRPFSDLALLCEQRYEEGKRYPMPLNTRVCPDHIDERRVEAALVIEDGVDCLHHPDYTGDDDKVCRLAERQGSLEDGPLDKQLARVPVHG